MILTVVWLLKLLYTLFRNQTTTGCGEYGDEHYYYTPFLEIKPQPNASVGFGSSDYYTPFLEIKPQQRVPSCHAPVYYYTPFLEIKPQLVRDIRDTSGNYYTPFLEIKPQPIGMKKKVKKIIIHPF